MRVVRFILRFFGWLLTPLVAWAASFLGAVAGARLSVGLRSGRWSLVVTLVCGAVAAALAAWGWLALLRRSRTLRKTLQVTKEGAPVVTLGTESPRSES